MYHLEYPDTVQERLTLLQNMNLAADDGLLNLAGVLLFAERPEWIKPQFIVKAIRYPGIAVHASEYLDSEDFVGPLPQQFTDALAFVLTDLRKVHPGRGWTAAGNAGNPALSLRGAVGQCPGASRLSLVSAPIRLFIFDDRIEIVSPGHLPNNLTVANPHRQRQHSQSDPGVVHRQGAAALPGPRFGYQTGAGRLAGD